MDEMMAAAEAIAGEGIHNAKSAVTRGFWPVSARLLRELRSGAAGAAFPRTVAERFPDNRLDGPGTSAAFGTASEAPVNLLRGARQIFCCGDGCANVVIGQHVTGTNDHENGTRCDDECGSILLGHPAKRKGKSACFEQFQTAEDPQL